jgi:hypothetical protein
MVMTVKREKEEQKEAPDNVWFTAFSEEGKPELGAYIPANARRSDPSLSVFWCGDTSRSQFRNAIERAERLFLTSNGMVLGTLVAYGPTKKIFGPFTRFADSANGSSSDPGLGECLIDENPLSRFSAYRAEFFGAGEQVILWANVVETDTGELEDGGDNIGICTSPALFDGSVRTLVVDTIVETRQGTRPATRPLGREVVDELLKKIADEVQSVSPDLKG